MSETTREQRERLALEAAAVEKARNRALLIAAQDADAPRLTERLDAESMRVLVGAFDALRSDARALAEALEAARNTLGGYGYDTDREDAALSRPGVVALMKEDSDA